MININADISISNSMLEVEKCATLIKFDKLVVDVYCEEVAGIDKNCSKYEYCINCPLFKRIIKLKRKINEKSKF